MFLALWLGVVPHVLHMRSFAQSWITRAAMAQTILQCVAFAAWPFACFLVRALSLISCMTMLLLPRRRELLQKRGPTEQLRFTMFGQVSS